MILNLQCSIAEVQWKSLRLNELVKFFSEAATDSYERSPANERRLKRDRKCEPVEVHSLLVSFPDVLAATKIHFMNSTRRYIYLIVGIVQVPSILNGY